MLIRRIKNTTVFPLVPDVMSVPELIQNLGYANSANQAVTAENSQNLATAYRCINVLGDDLAKMPLQQFSSFGPGQIQRVKPDSRKQNISWLLEVSPNRWMNPFIFKKTLMRWLITWGAAYAWKPVVSGAARKEIFILDSSQTVVVADKSGNIWYRTTFSNGTTEYLPYDEVMTLLINSSDGLTGKSVISYARESLGRQMGAYETEGKFFAHGLNPSGILWVEGSLNPEARAKMREEFENSMSGSENAYRLAIMDNKVSKFDPITMKPSDAQFLESIQQNDLEIANFFGMPLFKLNMGKQAYNSNEQANLDYLNTTLDPYLVQFEQEALLKWLTAEEQNTSYFRFNRDVLLRTDAETRSNVVQKRIQSGVLTPNEGRQIEDLPAYKGGDKHYFPANMGVIDENGNLIGVNGATNEQ